MKPIGLLMREHRLIERMVDLTSKQVSEIDKTGKVDLDFIEAAADFFRTYADRTHHGKEEEILFRDLAKKALSKEHKEMVDGLIADHIFGRRLVSSLAVARENYIQGKPDSVADIAACMSELVKLYPAHIEREDKRFFVPSMEYFSQEEQDKMLQEFLDFDQKMIHEKYQTIIEGLSKSIIKSVST